MCILQYECLVQKCKEKFSNSADRREHMIVVHKFPPKFKFDRTETTKSQPASRKQETDTKKKSVLPWCMQWKNVNSACFTAGNLKANK